MLNTGTVLRREQRWVMCVLCLGLPLAHMACGDNDSGTRTVDDSLEKNDAGAASHPKPDAGKLACEERSIESCGEDCIEVHTERYAMLNGECAIAEDFRFCRHSSKDCDDADAELVSCADGHVWYSSHLCMPPSHHECTASELYAEDGGGGDIFANRCREP